MNYGNIEKIEKNTELEHVIVTNIADYLPKMKRIIGKLVKKIPTAKYSKSKTIELLCGKYEFSRSRVDSALSKFFGSGKGKAEQVTLTDFN